MAKLRFNLLLKTLFITLVVFTPAIHAKERADPLLNYQPQKVAEHTWAIFGSLETPNELNQGFMNNPAFVITDKSVLVFDPGSSSRIGKSLLSKIKSITYKPISHIFISHIHGDHWLASHAIKEEYPNIKIYSHKRMLEEAEAGEAESWLALMNKLTVGATEGTIAALPTDTLVDKQIIEDKVLITGDNNFNKRMPRLDDGSFAGNLKSMDVALALDVEKVISGHGAVGGKEILIQYKDFLTITRGAY